MISKEKNKRKYLVFLLALFVFSGAIFAFSDVQSAYAAERVKCTLDGLGKCMLGNAGITAGQIGGAAGSAAAYPFKLLLYEVFRFVNYLTSVAVTIFGWAINPEYISGATGFFNRPAIYELWKFIRDFFNLFFILVLLYIAFTVVFQIQKNFKKALLSLILAALLVNFSFPISRFMIDVANVPMYFFANQMLTDPNKPGESFGTALRASQLQKIILPQKANSDISRLLTSIVFMFIFSITILVLAVMFVIRLAALLILVIFSSVGFAASIIPGMEQYSKMWWDNFRKYALFGPAAMLMLLVATRFFTSITENDSTFQNFQAVAGGAAASQVDLGFIASMAFFSIPIVMLWMTIGLASKVSIVGGAMMEGKGKAFAKWAGRKTYNNPATRGFGGGVKERYQKSTIGRFISSPSKTEATIKGGIAGGWGGGAKERAKIDRQAVAVKVKENKEKQVSDTDHIRTLKDSKASAIDREAAALSLAESKGIRNAEVLADSIAAAGDHQDSVLKILDSVKPEAIGGMDKGKHATIQNAFYEKDAQGSILKKDGKPVIRSTMQDAHDAYNGKLKKEGNVKVKVDYELEQTGFKAGDTSEAATAARTAVYKDNFDKMGAEDIVKQKDLYKDPGFKQYVQNNRGPKFMQAALEKATEKGGKETLEGWLEMSADSSPAPKIEVAEGYRTRKA